MTAPQPTPSAAITFTVPGPWPVKRRPRFAQQGRVYNPAQNKKDEARVRDSFVAACVAAHGHTVCAPAGAPVTVAITLQRPMPKSHRGESEADCYRPDLDNCAKSVLDGLNELAYGDDSQVTTLTVQKRPRTRDAPEGIGVTVSWGMDGVLRPRPRA